MSDDELLDAIEGIEEGATVSQPRDAHDRAHRLLLSSLYSRAVEAASSLEWPQAVNLFSQIRKIDPDYKDTRDWLAHTQVQARLAALYSAALDALEDERWFEAVDSLSEIVGVDADYDDAAELLTQAGMALAESKTQERLVRPCHDGLSYGGNEDRTEAQARFDPVLGADSDELGTASLAAPARRRARWSRSILGRISQSLTGWWRAPSETDLPTTEADDLHVGDELHAADEPRLANKVPPPERRQDTESELRKEHGG